ncbi:hypothetical protein GPJ56_000343 [Histomonas meleagridis]|uniref:uncharacterized protein n=1 Tax=Histomonas meleagridis TaxID=135588 RepID=UPI00355A1B5F|nr:hypothetical protein GPJ56_000343 [Histomonas meleagridis]KAH0798384.1 hypothetical protein GO595_008776 [Histomonas meleagridis]
MQEEKNFAPLPEIFPTNDIPMLGTETEEYLNRMILEEIDERNKIQREMKEDISKFYRATQTDVCFDPTQIEFMIQANNRIDALQKRLEKLNNGQPLSHEEVEETKARVNAYSSFFSDQGESLLKSIELMEAKTQQIIGKSMPHLIACYEKELIINHDNRKKISDLNQQK